MSQVSKTREYATAQQLTATLYNQDRDEIIAGVNSINNAQIASDAAISASKLSGVPTLTGTETFTNKTLTAPILNKPVVNGSTQALTADSDATTITFDMSLSNIHTTTLGGNRTLAVSNVSVGQAFMLRIGQDATGSRVPTWFTTIKWDGGSPPVLTTTATKIDVFGFLCTSANNYDGYVVGQNL